VQLGRGTWGGADGGAGRFKATSPPARGRGGGATPVAGLPAALLTQLQAAPSSSSPGRVSSPLPTPHGRVHHGAPRAVRGRAPRRQQLRAQCGRAAEVIRRASSWRAAPSSWQLQHVQLPTPVVLDAPVSAAHLSHSPPVTITGRVTGRQATSELGAPPVLGTAAEPQDARPPSERPRPHRGPPGPPWPRGGPRHSGAV